MRFLMALTANGESAVAAPPPANGLVPGGGRAEGLAGWGAAETDPGPRTPSLSSRRLEPVVLLFVCLGLRLVGLDWDQGSYGHPDERFLTMLGARMRMPSSLAEYLDPSRSPLNPYNAGQPFFVYGTLPLTIDKVVARLTGMDSLRGLTLQGRALAALADSLTAVLVYLLCEMLERRGRLPAGTRSLAMLFYALSVLPLQLANFFTVDPFLVCLLTLTVTAALHHHLEGKPLGLVVAAVAFGLAMATKVTALQVLPVVGVLVVAGDVRARAWGRAAARSAVFGAVAVLVLRLADPHLFAAHSPLDLGINPQFLDNLRTLASLDGTTRWFPPAVQWLDRTPVLFPLKNLALWGLGPVLFALATTGAGLVAMRLARGERRAWEVPLLLAWTVAVFLFQSAQPVKSMRYFAPLYPYLAVLAGLAAATLLRSSRRAWRGTGSVVVALTLLWPVSFLAIYTRPNTRVAASRWLYHHVPPGTHIAVEHWDDTLPLPAWRDRGRRYVIRELPVFDPDTDAKWEKMNALLADCDVLVLASNRGWGSISRVPARYPRMSAFYADLFAGRTAFVKAADFTSFPTLELGLARITIPDGAAEEAFTVYDHPRVLIFRRLSPP